MVKFVAAIAITVATQLVHSNAHAQTNPSPANYPNRPIKIVVGYPPGGSGDFTTRVIADELSREFGVAVVVDNRPGAGGTIASDIVAKAPADGYTILNGGHQTINKELYRKLPYDPDKDLAAVCLVATGTTVLVVNNNLPVHNLRELIAYAKANPGKLFSASAGFGSAPHLASVQFEAAAGVKFTTVQFKGGGPAAQSLLAGDTQVMFATSPTVTGFIKAARMRPIIVSKRVASPSIPGIPGAEEGGLRDYESTFWFGLFVPSGTPTPIMRRVHEAAARSLAKPEVRERIAQQGMDATPSASPQAFEAQIKAEAPEWERAIRNSG
ncbi:MAG: tripartite tricarboxylate transporter substrate binding protein, partial [Burkholderiales bacterium]